MSLSKDILSGDYEGHICTESNPYKKEDGKGSFHGDAVEYVLDGNEYIACPHCHVTWNYPEGKIIERPKDLLTRGIAGKMARLIIGKPL